MTKPDPAPLPPDGAPAATRLGWSGLTHLGRVRANNEDSFLALTFDGHAVQYLGKIGEAPQANADFVFAVSDGMGGQRSGEFASRIAVERITQLLPRAFRLGAGGLAAGFQDILSQLIADIHEDLLRLGASYEECSGMGATLSLAWFTLGQMYFCHVGDSRIYYQGAGGAPLRQLTHDHTHVGWLRRNGTLTEREARAHPRRNALNQALGAGHQFVEPQIGAVACGPGDRFLLCTDGLIDGLWDHRLEAQLRDSLSIQNLAPRLVDEALEAGGRDNITALAIEAS